MKVVMAASLGKLDRIRGFLGIQTLPTGRSPSGPFPPKPNDHWITDSACVMRDVISDALDGPCRNGHTAVAALLIERGAGADLTIRDTKFDSTAEGWAAEGRHDEICELLHRR